MGIRAKILFGFLILATMLFLAGAWSIYELRTVGTSVQRLLDDNYKSIHAARVMIEALEREDSAVLLLLAGNWKEGREIIASADPSFQQGFEIAQNNVTISGEKACVDEIGETYSAYKDLWAKPIVGTKRERDLNWYFKELHQSFLEAKSAVERLMALNDQAMYQTAMNLKNRAHRAIMPGIVAILAALVFTLVFTYLVNYYLVSPVIRITQGVQSFLQTKEPFHVKVETSDEFQRLATSLQELVTQCKKLEAV